MQNKKIVYFLSIILFFSGFLFNVHAMSNPNVSFHGVGITINLTFPEEAHPLDNIVHNITITADTTLTIINYTIFIYAPVNASWQEVTTQGITSVGLDQNQSLPFRMNFTLPQETIGRLWCVIYLLTDQSVDYFSATFYTTQVNAVTFTELKSKFNELLSNYTILQTDYDALLQDYDSLLANYSNLVTDYETTQNEYNSLSNDYNSRVATYQTLLNTYNSISTEHNTLISNYEALQKKYNNLQSDYDSLNSTNLNVQASYDSLNNTYRALNQTYVNLETQINELNQKINLSDKALNNDKILMLILVVTLVCLIALIAYIKRKGTEPYLVIRKETVTVKPEEGSQSKYSKI